MKEDIAIFTESKGLRNQFQLGLSGVQGNINMFIDFKELRN